MTSTSPPTIAAPKPPKKIRAKCQFATLSTSSRKDFDAAVEGDMLLRSALMRSWVAHFIAQRDAALPTSSYVAPWQGMSGASVGEKIQFRMDAAAKAAFRARAKALGFPQTVILRAWIETFCAARASKPSPAAKIVAVIAEAPRLFHYHVPTELFEGFKALCKAEGRHPMRMVRAWVEAYALGVDDGLPPVEAALTRSASDERIGQPEAPKRQLALNLPKETIDRARARAESEGRDLTAFLTLWILACESLNTCSAFGDARLPLVQGASRRRVLRAESSSATGAKRGTAGRPKSATAGAESLKDTYFTAPVSRALKAAFDKKCEKESKAPAKVLRHWLSALAAGDRSRLPPLAPNSDATDASEMGDNLAQSRARINRTELAAAQANAEGGNLSKMARGWMRAYVSQGQSAAPKPVKAASQK